MRCDIMPYRFFGVYAFISPALIVQLILKVNTYLDYSVNNVYYAMTMVLILGRS